MRQATISIKEMPEKDYVVYKKGRYIITLYDMKSDQVTYTHEFEITDEDISESVKRKEQIMEEFDKLIKMIKDWK